MPGIAEFDAAAARQSYAMIQRYIEDAFAGLAVGWNPPTNKRQQKQGGNPMKRRRIHCCRPCAVRCWQAARARPADAQTYPSKPIRTIVAIAAGSVTDVIMRAAANELAPRLGQSLVIENIGGASGILAGTAVRGRRARRLYDLHALSLDHRPTIRILFNKLPYDAETRTSSRSRGCSS